MTFTRTFDAALIRRVMTHPKVYCRIGDDSAPPVEEFEPNLDPRLWYIAVHEGGELLGLFLLLAQNTVCYEIHVCLLPASWGRTAEAGRGVLAWAFQHTPARRIVAQTYLAAAARLARRSGMEPCGVQPKSFLKDGVLQDQLLFGISG